MYVSELSFNPFQTLKIFFVGFLTLEFMTSVWSDFSVNVTIVLFMLIVTIETQLSTNIMHPTKYQNEKRRRSNT